MSEPHIHTRHLASRLVEALEDSPVVLVHGPRQCGKTTLARSVGEQRGYPYVNFDDDVAREAAEYDPAGFVAEQPERVILDEVQRVPTLFTALKMAVDQRRVAGRFLLTGSSHVLLVPKLADSLAGRMAILRLHPLSQSELHGRPSGFLDKLFAGEFNLQSDERLGPDLAERIAAGGFPPALARPSGRRRTSWHRDYVEALVQRDLNELARINDLDVLRRLLALAVAQTAGLFNIAGLASPFRLSEPTIRRYVLLLEQVFLLDRLPPWHSNRKSRLVKTSKLHFEDTGVACALLGMDGEALQADRNRLGPLLETFVYQELRRQAASHDLAHAFFHFRNRDGMDVDLVIERGTALAGVEVKAGATVRADDFRGLHKLQRTVGRRFAGGVVLYDGETTAPFGEGMYAVPIRRLWEG